MQVLPLEVLFTSSELDKHAHLVGNWPSTL